MVFFSYSKKNFEISFSPPPTFPPGEVLGLPTYGEVPLENLKMIPCPGAKGS